jgi:MFS transporter, PAT family, beta-lactamase induction signal transducer AmpG
LNYPNLLSTRFGRLTALSSLYACKGIPYGFTSVTIVNEMNKQHVSPAAIGWYSASLAWPWAMKWVFGPILDIFYSPRLGRRRTWLFLSQIVMAVALLAACRINFSREITLFIAIILIHNIFAAIQGVAMGALACDSVPEQERGLANGLMSAGAYLGVALGGAGALFLIPHVGFLATNFFVAGSIIAIMLTITLPIREPPLPPKMKVPGLSSWRTVREEIATYLKVAAQAMLQSRPAIWGMIFALFPPGAFALGMAFATMMIKELQISDRQFGVYTIVVGAVSSVFCIVGGVLSDRFGRRLVMAISVAGVALPTLVLAYYLQKQGFIVPGKPSLPIEPQSLFTLVIIFWAVSVIYAAVQGIGYSVQMAIFMDVTSPAVAATQFTAYAALANVMRSYYPILQGYQMGWWGYPSMLVFDSCFGLLCLIPLMFISKRDTDKGELPSSPDAGARVKP